MLPEGKRSERSRQPIISTDSQWMRAPQSGILRSKVALGDIVDLGQVLGIVADPFGELEEEVVSATAGVIVGKTNLPLIHEGEALFHVAQAMSPDSAAESVDAFVQEYES